MLFVNPLRAAMIIAKSAGLVMVGTLGLVLIHNLQAAEGRRVKIHVMEQVAKLNERVRKDELRQVKLEAELAAEHRQRIERADAVQHADGDIRTCPLEQLRCVEL